MSGWWMRASFLRLFNSSVLLKLYKQKWVTPLVAAAHIFTQTTERGDDEVSGSMIFVAYCGKGIKTTTTNINFFDFFPPYILGYYLKA